MTNTIQSAPSGADRVVVPTNRHRGRTVVLLVLVLLVALGAGLAWVGLGTLRAGRVIQQRAATAATELAQFRSTLEAGDNAGASAHLAAGEQSLMQAQTAADGAQVRVARYLPYVGRTVGDLDHLLAAARILSDAGGSALTVYLQFSGANSKAYSGHTFNIPAIRSAGASLAALNTALARAEGELRRVTGTGPRGAEALAKRDAALAQVTSLRQQVGDLGPLLAAMPAAVGANGPRSYLVTVLNPAESRASGGAPLSLAFVHLDKGRLSIPIQGQTSVLTNGNEAHVFTPVAGDPWLQGRAPRRFVNANVNPDFTVAGEQLLRASSGLGEKPDGVIALDVQAIGDLLQATGPLQSFEYGELTAANVAQKLVVDAYLAPQDQAARHDRNDRLMGTMLQRLTDGGGLIAKARALGTAVPGRHLQMYFRDPALQKVVAAAGASGRVMTGPTGDLAAAYTQNLNGSKVDTYQKRTLKETITMAADGSATVRRTVVIENRTPQYLGGGSDPKFGYYTRWARLLVINLMPPGSTTTARPTGDNSPGFVVGTAQHKGTDGAGRPYADAIAEIRPGGTAQLTWDYTVPRAAVRDGAGLRLLVRAETQPLLNPPDLQVTVVAPRGWQAEGGPGWKATAGGATATATIDQARLLQLKVVPPA